MRQSEFIEKIQDMTGEKKNISTISSWENGYTSPGSSLIPYIAEILQVSISDLYGEKRNKEPGERPAKQGVSYYQKILESSMKVYENDPYQAFKDVSQSLKSAILELSEATDKIKALEIKLGFAKEVFSENFKSKDQPKG